MQELKTHATVEHDNATSGSFIKTCYFPDAYDKWLI